MEMGRENQKVSIRGGNERKGSVKCEEGEKEFTSALWCSIEGKKGFKVGGGLRNTLDLHRKQQDYLAMTWMSRSALWGFLKEKKKKKKKK